MSKMAKDIMKACGHDKRCAPLAKGAAFTRCAALTRCAASFSGAAFSISKV